MSGRPPISAATRLLAVLGHPVAHSASPALHNAALAHAGVDAVYLAFDVAPDRLADAVAGLRAARWLGASCTVPHKHAALALADRASDEAAAIGAANTLCWDADGALLADNTDAEGLRAELADLGVAAGWTATLVGSGGAARAAAVALGRQGAQVRVAARRREPAEQVAALAAAWGSPGAQAVGLGEAGEADLLVNATPLGLAGERLPPPYASPPAGQVVLDLVYAPGDTPLVAAARQAGATARDGLGMLVAQAAGQFVRWTGVKPDRRVMRAAAERALGRGAPQR